MKLLSRTGINVQPGHTWLSHRCGATNWHLMLKKLYALGCACEVIVQWQMMSSTVRNPSTPDRAPGQCQNTRLLRWTTLRTRPAVFGVRSDPQVPLNGGRWQAFRLLLKLWTCHEANAQCNATNKVSWTVVLLDQWAKAVFFKCYERWIAVDFLLTKSFKLCRVYEEDPVKALGRTCSHS